MFLDAEPSCRAVARAAHRWIRTSMADGREDGSKITRIPRKFLSYESTKSTIDSCL